jgi:hypothetical protein
LPRHEDQIDPNQPGRVEDYTGAFLVAAGVLCMMVLTAIWVVWGFAAALFLSWTADRAMVFEERRGRRG